MPNQLFLIQRFEASRKADNVGCQSRIGLASLTTDAPINIAFAATHAPKSVIINETSINIRRLFSQGVVEVYIE